MKEENCDQAHYYFPFSTTPYDTNSSLSCPTFQQEQEPKEEKLLSGCGTREELKTVPELPVKWMSSKMRLMRKMMGEPNRHCSNSSSNGIVRVCSNCSTTKTPLWRSGPQGPKVITSRWYVQSLCNACGIRQMKARRAMRAAAAAAGVMVPDSTVPKKAKKKERISEAVVDRSVPFKKRFKIPSANSSGAQKKIRFDNMTIGSSKKLAFHQTFPQEEKDAAVLLMALSCGLIHV